MSNWDDVCSRFGIATAKGSAMMKCPVPSHADGTASLSIKRKEDGDVLAHCFAGCDWRVVRDALGLTHTARTNGPDGGRQQHHPRSYSPSTVPTVRAKSPEVLAAPPAPASDPGGDAIGIHGVRCEHSLATGTPLVEYPYCDATGSLVGLSVRYVTADGKKVFRPFAPDGRTGEPEAMKATLYRLPEALAAIGRGESIALCEGERDVDTLRRLGIPALCNPMGAKHWRPAHATLCAGAKEVLVFNDDDTPGERLALEQCADLSALTPAPVVRRVMLPGVLNGYRVKDVSDFIAAGGTRHDLNALMVAALPWTAHAVPLERRERPRTLREWLEDPNLLTPPATVIPYLAWEGRVTLFSAREKIGKSTLAGQAVAVATRGGEFLGGAVAPCGVLWYGIDEPIGDAARRLTDNGADLDRAILHDVRPESAEEMRADLAAFPGVRLVVMDTLTELASGHLESDKDAQQIATFIRPYVEVARSTGVALLLVHHTTKAGREYRGSVQLGASVDVKVQLRQPDRGDEEGVDDEPATDDGIRFLDAKGRNVSFGVRLQFDAGRYRLADAPSSMRERVLQGVIDYGPATGTKLAEAMGGRKQRVLETLKALRTEGVCFAPDGQWQLTPVGRRETATPGSGDVALGTGGGNSTGCPGSGDSSLENITGTGPAEAEQVALNDAGYPASWDGPLSAAA